MRTGRAAIGSALVVLGVVLCVAWAPPALGQEADSDVTARFVNAFPTGNPATSVILIERITRKEVRVRAPFQYEINVTNLTEVALADVTVTEQLPSGFSVEEITPEPKTRSETSASWTFAELGPKQARTIRVRGTPTRLGDINPCNTVTFSTSLCQTTKVVEPALGLTKTAPAEVIICDPIPLNFRVTNNGTGRAHNVKITDTLPDGWTTSDGRKELSFDAGILGAGESKEFSAQVQSGRTGTFTNKATATEAGGLTATADAQTIVRKPDLEVTKKGPDLRYLGRTATYEISVKNTGDAVARNTVLTDTVDPGTKFVRANKGGEFREGRVTWNLGNLQPGASATVEVELQMMERKVVRNTAEAKAYCAEDQATASTTVKGIPALLLEVIDVEDPIEVGANETYVITVTNQGSAEGTGIVIECTLPEEQEFVSAEGPTKHGAREKTVRFDPLPTLDVGAKATFRVVVKGTKEADARFRVSMTGDQLSSPVTETESTHIYR